MKRRKNNKTSDTTIGISKVSTTDAVDHEKASSTTVEANVDAWITHPNINHPNHNCSDKITGDQRPIPTSNASLLTTIETSCRIHEDLCDACYITEEYFSVVMLTIVTIGFLIIVFNAYYVLEMLLRHGGDIEVETLLFIMFLVYQMFIHGLGLVCIVQNSSAVQEEVCTMCEDVSKLS